MITLYNSDWAFLESAHMMADEGDNGQPEQIFYWQDNRDVS